VKQQIKNLFQMKFKESFVIFVAICCIFVAGEESKYCGRKFSASGLIFGGNKTQSNEWPWLVALVNWPKNEFFCGGSLISSKHVVSGEICRVCV
jgi:secreted trypsin-like serine protease